MSSSTHFDPVHPPPPLQTGEVGSFAQMTMTTRLPAVAQQVLADYRGAYPPVIVERVQAVHDELVHDQPMTPLQTRAPDREHWQQAWQRHAGKTWLDVPWFFAEAFFYRKLLEASGYFGHDVWAGVDPFEPRKRQELYQEGTWQVLLAALHDSRTDTLASLQRLLYYGLWGNRMDLSYTQIIADAGSQIDVDREIAHILVDDSAPVLAHLQAAKESSGAAVHLICDNAGIELLTDLVLADFLLRFAWVQGVTLHVKAHPTYVSDTTPADVALTLAAMQAQPHADITALAERLQAYQAQQQLRVRPDFFWTSSHFFWELTTAIRADLSSACLVISKGDANYRRLLGDSRWLPTVPARQAMPYFPAPLLALRTLKADPIVGLPAGVAEALDREDPTWRVNGKRGLIQAIL